MASFKFAFIALLAFGALECRCAEMVAVQQPREMNIFLAAQNAIAIARNVIAAVGSGIEDSKPNLDILIQQLTPELGKAVRKVVDEMRELLHGERERIEFMIKEVEQFLDAMKNVKSCTDQERKNIEKLLGNFENGLLDAYRDTKTNHAKPLGEMMAGYKRIINNIRNLFDGEMEAVTECIRRGNPNAKKCLENEMEKTKKAVVSIAVDAFMFTSEVKEVLMNFTTELIGRGKPVVDKFIKGGDPIMKKVSDCIAKLK